jgi:phage-related minor tail protein
MRAASGAVLTTPTYFPTAGGLALAGEAGAEAVLPLERGGDGRLGVRASGGSRPVAVTVHVTTPDVEGFRRSEAQVSASIARAVARGQRAL